MVYHLIKLVPEAQVIDARIDELNKKIDELRVQQEYLCYQSLENRFFYQECKNKTSDTNVRKKYFRLLSVNYRTVKGELTVSVVFEVLTYFVDDDDWSSALVRQYPATQNCTTSEITEQVFLEATQPWRAKHCTIGRAA